jgi:hypothetical protein
MTITLRKRLKTPESQIRAGLIALGFAGIFQWFVHSRVAGANDWTDGFSGFFYGIAIGLMLLGIWRQGRRNRRNS